MIAEKAITLAGILMFFSGLVMFYSIEDANTDSLLVQIKNMGTFIGLSGVGVIIAGMLLLLIRQNTPQMQES